VADAHCLYPKRPDGLRYRMSVAQTRLPDLRIAFARRVDAETPFGGPHCPRDAAQELETSTSQLE